MDSLQSYLSTNNVSQFESELLDAKQSWDDNYDMKLQYLVDSAKKNFDDVSEFSQMENSDGFYDSSSPSASSLHSYESILDEDEFEEVREKQNIIPPKASIFPAYNNGMITPELRVNHSLKQLQIHTQEELPKELHPYMLTPMEGPQLEWRSGPEISQTDFETYTRVIRQTQDFSAMDIDESGQLKTDQLYSSFQGQFVSPELNSQVLAFDVPFIGQSPQSTITQPSSASSFVNTPLVIVDHEVKKSSIPKKKKKTIKKPKFTYDINATPIAQQLEENKQIWNKLMSKKKKGIYKCTHCPQVFKELIDLAKHMDGNKIAREHKCPFDDCPWSIIGLPRRAEVRRHCAAQHSFVVTFENDNKNLREQSIPSSGSSPCGETSLDNCFNSLSSVAEKYICQNEFCEKTFKRKDSLQRHEKLVHANLSSRFNKRIDKLKLHYKTEDIELLRKILESKKRKKSSIKSVNEQENEDEDGEDVDSD